MKRRKTVAVFAVVCAGLSVLAACGSSGGSGSSGSSGSSGGGYNAAVTGVVRPSTQTGGTLNVALTSTPDSTDPGNTYYAFNWDISRLYARPLLTYAPKPGAAGLQLVPDLATSLGQMSDNGLTWTYHLRPGEKFEDGTPITSEDVKYAVERSTNYAPDVLANGPTYFKQYLTDPTYPGAYKDTTPNKLGLTGITTPDPQTVVFHLQHPFAEFDYLASLPQTAPVPPAKDTGANYQNHPISSGPYMFKSYDPNKGYTLVRNPNWSKSVDPVDTALPDEVNVEFNIAADDIDNRLLNGSLDLDLDGTGVQTATRAKILNNKTLQENADDPVAGFLDYGALNTQVAPLNNVDCRKAIEYAVDKTAQQTAYGGPIAGGDIASTILPPTVAGYTRFDLYNATSQAGGDIAMAKQELAACGKPNGFTVNISARGDRPKEVSAAESIQAALKQVGINAQILQYQSGQYFSNFAGVPTFTQSHDVGIILSAWGADWPTGFGFLSQIVDSRAIKAAGNSNMQMTMIPQVNQLLDQSTQTTTQSARNQLYGQIDKIVMGQAEILPEVYAKSLQYRNPAVTNAIISEAYNGMYDYTQIGVSG